MLPGSWLNKLLSANFQENDVGWMLFMGFRVSGRFHMVITAVVLVGVVKVFG